MLFFSTLLSPLHFFLLPAHYGLKTDKNVHWSVTSIYLIPIIKSTAIALSSVSLPNQPNKPKVRTSKSFILTPAVVCQATPAHMTQSLCKFCSEVMMLHNVQ